ncbi:MAG: ABC transporter substrate-binding protein [Qingshengfaniella sp.]
MSILRTVLCLWVVGATALQAAPRDSLVLAIGGEPETGFDPVLGWGMSGTPLFQSTLLTRDAHLATRPDLATDWRLSDDRRVWTIRLRPDARFSDGTPLTARDVAFTFQTAKAAAGPVDLRVLDQAEAVDDQTVRLTLSRPWTTFAEAFFTLGIVPADRYGPDYGRDPIGSGPYRLVSWTEGEQLIVARNEAYYGPMPAFTQLTFLFAGSDTRLAAARAGVADLVAVPGQLADAVPAGFRAVAVPSVDSRGLSLPFLEPQQIDGRPVGNAVTADPAIRQAINLGLDRDLLVEVALHGHGSPAFGPVDGLPWDGRDDHVRFDPAAARAVLEDAGWVPGADGVREKDGQRASFTINFPAGDPTRQALAETVTALLHPLGISAQPKGGSWDAIGRVMHAEPVVFGFGSHSPYELYSLYASELGGIGYMNPTYYRNPQVDALFAKAQDASSLEAAVPYWAQAAAQYGVQGDNAWAWLVNLDHVYMVNSCLALGEPQIEPHEHGWPITATIAAWRWTCD